MALLTLSLAGAAHAQAPFKLILSASEHKLQKGEVTTHALTKSWRLPAAAVKASKAHHKVSSTLGPVLAQIEQAVDARRPIPATFRNVGGSWVATEQTGWIFDREGTKANLLKAIMSGKGTAQVAYRRVVPARSVQVLAQRGVFTHVSTGTSSYRGSPAFRV